MNKPLPAAAGIIGLVLFIVQVGMMFFKVGRYIEPAWPVLLDVLAWSIAIIGLLGTFLIFYRPRLWGWTGIAAVFTAAFALALASFYVKPPPPDHSWVGSLALLNWMWGAGLALMRVWWMSRYEPEPEYETV
jgi:hypothetical protein